MNFGDKVFITGKTRLLGRVVDHFTDNGSQAHLVFAEDGMDHICFEGSIIPAIFPDSMVIVARSADTPSDVEPVA